MLDVYLITLALALAVGLTATLGLLAVSQTERLRRALQHSYCACSNMVRPSA